MRGDRTDMPLIFPLEHEMTFQRLLGEHGIPVATVRGWIDEPMAYVMDRVGGQEHFGDTGDEDRAAAELRTLFRLARHLQRRDEISDAVEQADLDDLELLLGARPHDWRDGEAKLEAFVLADTGGKHDTELVRLFHKRNLRAQMLLGPANSAMTHHHMIQKF